MTTEAIFESELVVKYISNTLDYTQVDTNLFNGQLLMIPSKVREFFMSTQAALCKDIIRKEYAGNENAFWDALYPALSEYLYESNYNVAIQLSPLRYGGFKFLNTYQFFLYYAFDSKKDDRNQYQVIPQIYVRIGSGKRTLSIKPDVGMFINGFLFSNLQLKLQHRNQSAGIEGRGEVLSDYLEAVLLACDILPPQPTDSEAKAIRSKTLKLFHGVAHHVAMDFSEAFVLRGFSLYGTSLENELKASRAGGDQTKNDMLEAFRMEPTYIKEEMLGSKEKMEKVLHNLYSHTSIQNEILYYNFLRYENYSIHKDGKKTVANRVNNPTLGFPRPNQKYGVDRVMEDVVYKYANEHDPDFELHRLESRLTAAGIPPKQRAEVLEKRRAYKNNRQQYSILLQYAAGFGKTNIICWLALQLKDLLNSSVVSNQSNDHLFEKILLLTDRIELRDQIDLAMRNMNIEKSLFKEANTTQELVKYLASNSGPRIIIVNIQKFPFLSEFSDAKTSQLKDKRVAIIIDEIHRSNSGKQHSDMTSLFDDITDATTGDNKDGTKKNLIIGLTATPTDENLIRFGEYQGCMEDIKWMPLDAYTMREAVNDGFIMDPTKSIVPYSVELVHDLVDDSESYHVPNLKDYYENVEHYIRPVAKSIARILVSTTYRKISGRAKAMLACYSILAARRFYTELTDAMAKLTAQKEFEQFKDTKIYMVYSQNQEDTPAWDICGYSNEKEVIAAFRKDKNGIMIVVDKLQTGFDEPRLHSLFLCKECKGINAVQTVSRVNRILKGKEDTLVVDFSIDNVNIPNINQAFEKYAHIVVSETDTYRIKEVVETMFNKVLASEPYKLFYALYGVSLPNLILDEAQEKLIITKTQEYVVRMLLNEHAKKILTTDVELYLNYLQKMSLIENVIGLEAKYTDTTLIRMMTDLIHLVRQRTKTAILSLNSECVDFWLEKIGKVDSHNLPDIEAPAKRDKDRKFSDHKNSTGFNILDYLMSLNINADNKELWIEDYKVRLTMLFTKMIELDGSSDERLVIRIKAMQYGHTDDEIRSSFQKLFKSSKRRLKDMGMLEFLEEIEGNLALAETDFVEYVRGLV